MRRRHSNRLAATLVVVAVIVALALVTSPELRALLLLADSLGLDLLALLLATQLRHFLGYVLLPGAKATVNVACALAFCIASGAIRVYPKALPWRPFDKLLCPALVLATYGIRCRLDS
jgi:hypothetical protein